MPLQWDAMWAISGSLIVAGLAAALSGCAGPYYDVRPASPSAVSALPITAVRAEPVIIGATISAATAAVVATSAAATTTARSAETLVSSTGPVIVAIPVIVGTPRILTSPVFAPTAMPATVMPSPSVVTVIRIAVLVHVLRRGRLWHRADSKRHGCENGDKGGTPRPALLRAK
jgi:hypothetical protein